MIKSRVMRANEALSPFAKAALKAARKAHQEAVKENARWGLPMIYSINGKIVKVSARAILRKQAQAKAARAARAKARRSLK